MSKTSGASKTSKTFILSKTSEWNKNCMMTWTTKSSKIT